MLNNFFNKAKQTYQNDKEFSKSLIRQALTTIPETSKIKGFLEKISEPDTQNIQQTYQKSQSSVSISSNYFYDKMQWIQYSKAIYQSNISDICNQLNIIQNDILFHNLNENQSICPKFIVSKLEKQKQLVITIRGTKSFTDLLIDLSYLEVDFMNGKAHRGILIAANEILELIVQILLEFFISHQDFSLIINGHSLGGATSVLLTLLILQNQILAPSQVSCIAFAPPPVFYGDIDSQYNQCLQIIVHDTDIVPSLSYKSYNQLKEQKLNSLIPFRQLLNQKQTENQTFSDLHQLGELILIYRSENCLYKAVIEQKSYFQELKMLSTSIDDHLIFSYEKAINSLINN